MDFNQLLQDELGWEFKPKIPNWLNKYKWRPKYLYYEKVSKKYIAVDIIYHSHVGYNIYEKEVKKAKSKNKNLEVCLLASIDQSYDILTKFCKKLGFGLKVYRGAILNTVIPLSFEEITTIRRKKRTMEGWFPHLILDELKMIRKLKFKDELVI